MVKWIAKKIKLLTDPSDLIINQEEIKELQFELEGFVTYDEVSFQFQNEAAFNKIDKLYQISNLSANMTLYDLLPNNEEIDAKTEIDNDPMTVSIKLKASPTTKRRTDEQILQLTIKSNNHNITLLTHTSILTWTPVEAEMPAYMAELFADMWSGSGTADDFD